MSGASSSSAKSWAPNNARLSEVDDLDQAAILALLASARCRTSVKPTEVVSMKKPLLLSLLGGLALCAATPAFAQTEPPPPATTPPPNSAPVTSVGGGAIGVGAVEWLSPNVTLTGGQFVYDQPMFHIEALIGYNHLSHADNTSDSGFNFGVAGWYHLARGTNADFSIGGGAGLQYTSPAANASRTQFALEPGAEARVFLSPNFALSCRVGVAITFGDNNSDTTISIGGQTTAAVGFTYFFR
jgi:hypothetical protein